jgi:hypothetical protein
MHNEQTRRLKATDAHDKASECRDMARRVQKPEHRVMLEDMAETTSAFTRVFDALWERLAIKLREATEAASQD